MKTSLLAVAVFFASCRTSPVDFKCQTTPQCSGGLCLNHFCAFADGNCPSGYRYKGAGSQTGICAPSVIPLPGDMSRGEMSPGAAADMSVQTPTDLCACDMSQPIDLGRAGGLTWTLEDSTTTWRGVWGSGAGNVYAVGNAGKIGHRTATGTWLYSTSIATSNNLLQIWGTGPNDIYVVGDGLSSPSNTVTISHGTGNGTWTDAALNAHVVLLGVDQYLQYAYAQDSSGRDWTGSGGGHWTSGGPAAAGETTTAGWGLSSTNLYFAGSSAVYHWDGANNTQQTIGLGGTVNAIWGATATDLYLCATRRGIAYSHGDGTWTVQTENASGSACRGMWSSSASDVYAVGDAGMVLHSKGDGKWDSVAIPGVTTQNMYGVWGSGSNDVYIVGDGAILHGSM